MNVGFTCAVYGLGSEMLVSLSWFKADSGVRHAAIYWIVLYFYPLVIF